MLVAMERSVVLSTHNYEKTTLLSQYRVQPYPLRADQSLPFWRAFQDLGISVRYAQGYLGLTGLAQALRGVVALYAPALLQVLVSCLRLRSACHICVCLKG